MSQGMSTVSIDLGMVEAVGYVAQHNDFDPLKKRGLVPLPVETVLHLLEMAIVQPSLPFDHLVTGINLHPGGHWEGDVLRTDQRFSILRYQALSPSSRSKPGEPQDSMSVGRRIHW